MNKTEFNNAFDVFLQSDLDRQKKIEIKELENQIFKIKNECGSCSKWMTSQCNREKSHKVTMSERKCSDFNMCLLTNRTLAEKEQKLIKLQDTSN